MAKKIFLKSILAAAACAAMSAFPFAALAAGISLSPASAAVPSGQQFQVRVLISSDQAINAGQAKITFPIDKLRVVSVSRTSSIFKFWSEEPVFSNTAGTVSFGGGLASPGFAGQAGQVFSITFRAVGAGTAQVGITEGAVLANDGQGTNVLQVVSGGTYVISASAPATISPVAPSNKISSERYPDQNSWYNSPLADFSWTISRDTDAVSWELSRSAKSIPSGRYDATDRADVDLSDKEDGIWYFQLQLHTDGKWGSVSTRKIKVDRGAPVLGDIRRMTEDPTDPRPVFEWSAMDEHSGIKKYLARVGNGAWMDAGKGEKGSIALPLQLPGKRMLIVTAEDLAGNVSQAEIAFVVDSISLPEIIERPRRSVVADVSGIQVEHTVVAGSAAGASSVVVYFRKGSEVLELEVPVDEQGLWRAEYDGTLSSGTWTLAARAVDSRGAMSNETEPVLVVGGSAVDNIGQMIASWGFLALIILFLLGLSVFGLVELHLRIKHRRLKLKKEIVAAQMTLIKDFEQLEKDLEGRTTKTKKELQRDMDIMARDAGKELERLKKDIDS